MRLDPGPWITRKGSTTARTAGALGAGDGPLADRVAEAYLEHMETVFSYYERLSRDLLGREIDDAARNGKGICAPRSAAGTRPADRQASAEWRAGAP